MSTPRPRVLHVIGSLHVGGAERVLERLIIGTADRFDHVVATLRPGGPIGETFRSANIPVHLLAGARKELPLSIGKLRGLIRETQPSLVHGWMYHANAWAAAAMPRQRVPMAWGIRTVADPAREKRMTRWIFRASVPMAKRAGKIIYNSVASAESHEALGYPASARSVILNGFDLKRFHPDAAAGSAWRTTVGIAEDERVLLVPARLHSVKGHASLLRVLAHSRAELDGWRVVFMGREDGVTQSELARRAAEWGLAEQVMLLPEASAVEHAMQGADLVVLPSLWGESFPNSIGEAMACGCAVMASNVGGVASLVGKSGVLAQPESLEDWQRGLLPLLTATRAELAARGRAGAERIAGEFSVERMLSAYGDTMQSLMDTGGTR